ncbi:hypothetical protein PU560_10915 [Georgenia sp. 10Sc9-8]|uniref:DUF4190 domain-containing protein n=1 Tax=Georgenia halotolerans TaxID=3028317 RepID=A0ABT5TY29_9MICO|nr:hypothetical protein [Georgenia halotolerans]
MAQGNQVGGDRGQVGRTDSGSNVLSIIAFVLSAIALFFIPLVFGGAAIIAAIIALVRKERLAKIALIVAIAATVLGMVLGAIILSATT